MVRCCPGEKIRASQNYVAQPFYWGDEYPDFEQLEVEELRKLVETPGQTH